MGGACRKKPDTGRVLPAFFVVCPPPAHLPKINRRSAILLTDSNFLKASTVANSQSLTPKLVPDKTTLALAQALLDEPELDFAVLVGSRATGTARVDSDWDIALQWSPLLDWFVLLGKTETLRLTLAHQLNVAPDAIDLIDLRRANLTMCASVAEEGLPLAGVDSLAWARFLQRTWRELEDFYWDKQHAA